MHVCPECGGTSLYKDGLRHLKNGDTTQRWLCKTCGYRFSQKRPLKKVLNESINTGSSIFSNCQGSSETPNGRASSATEAVQTLAAVENPTKSGLAGATVQTADAKGKLIEFIWWMKKQGYSEATITGRNQILTRLMKLGADLLQCETVKEAIAKQTWSLGRKANAVYAYALFAKWAGIRWEPPRISIPQKLPFIPTREELSDLIAGSTKHVAVALQIALETGARVGEIFRLKWMDLDFEKAKIMITPEKGSNPRVFKMSAKLRQMLENMPKNGDRILSRYSRLNSLRRTFEKQRKRIAYKLGNPRLLQISFHTFRHWKATWEYYRTKDILHVMQILGHKRIQNTLKYTQLAKFEGEEEYICKVAKEPKEIAALIEVGFHIRLRKRRATILQKAKIKRAQV